MEKHHTLVREHKPKLFKVDSFAVDNTTTVKVFLWERIDKNKQFDRRKTNKVVKNYWKDILPPIEFEERYQS